MKKILIAFLSLLLGVPFLFGQTADPKFKILLAGASFASPNNKWFEVGCESLDAKPVNRAIGGQSIAVTANNMANGTFYSQEELETIDAFVIMHVHDRNVADQSKLKVSYEDYSVPFDYADYAPAYDYVIKRYMTDCYNLRYNKDSKYYNSPGGKPVIIVFCTHWHDAREVFNPAIRQLASRWGFPVVEFDKYIGFSKNTLHPVTGKQYSIIYASDTEEINGETFGWHPQEGADKYIQQRMGAIFADVMRNILIIK